MSHHMRLLGLWTGFLLLVILQVFEITRERAELEREARRQASSYARLVAEHATGTFQLVDIATQTLGQSTGVRQMLTNPNADSRSNVTAEVNNKLRDLVATIPGIGKAFVADADGRLLASTAGVTAGDSIAAQTYFKARRDNRSPALIIGASVQDQETGKWAIPILRRIVDEQGRLLGMVGITLDIEQQFASLYASLELPPGTPVSLWDTQRRLLMRFPMIAQRIGTASKSTTFNAFNDPDQLEYVTTDPSEFDGQMRTRAARKVRDYPLYAVVAMAETEYLKTWKEHRGTTAFAIGGMATLTLVFTGLLQRGNRQRTKIEQACAHHQEHVAVFAKIIESSLTAFVILDTDLRIVSSNAAFVGLIRQDAGQLLGRPLDQILPDEAGAALLPQCRLALAGPTQCLSVELHISDSARYFDIEVRPNMSSGVVVSLRDVTLPYMAQRALQRREAELQAIFEAAPECIKVFDANGTLVKINPTGLAIIEADDLSHGLATRIENLVVPEDRLAFLQFNMRILGGESGSFEFQGIGLKGTPRWLETNAVPIRDADGTITGALAITRELSQIRETEARLRATVEEQQAMLNNGIVGLVRLRDGHFVWVNVACHELLGYSHDELVGQSTRRVFADLNTYTEIGAVYQQIACGEKWHGRIPLTKNEKSPGSAGETAKV